MLPARSGADVAMTNTSRSRRVTTLLSQHLLKASLSPKRRQERCAGLSRRTSESRTRGVDLTGLLIQLAFGEAHP